MKIILTTILSFAVMCFVHAQNLEIVESSGSAKGGISEQLSIPIKIKNNTQRPIHIGIKRIDQLLGTSQEMYFCWGNECFESEVKQLPLSKVIEPGEVSIKFKSVLKTGLAPGFSTAKYLIYDRNNPQNAIEYEVTYTVEDDSKDKLIFSSDDIKINDVYPNPAVDFAIVDYNLLKEEVKAKIVVHNVLGSIIAEYDMSYFENKLKIKTEELNPGVYFYTLYIDNDGIMTRKLIIRK